MSEQSVNNYWSGKNVFVTGATGLLGSWVTKSLVEQNANVTILLRDLVPKSNLVTNGFIKKVNVVHGRLEDYSVIARALNEYEIDTCLHLAAQPIVGIANRSPLFTFEANIKGTWNMLEAVRNSPWVKRFVMASSDKAYGSQPVLPYTESAPLQGRHPYDVSKSCADLLGQAYFHTYGLPIAITRCGNFYGGGDLNFNRIVPHVMESVILNKQPIIRSDGTFLRDYLYIEDAADAYLTLAKALDNKEIHGQAFNFGNGTPISVLDLTSKIITLAEKNMTPQVLDEVRGEIKDQYLDSTKAKTMLNWTPKFGLEEGLRRTFEWYSNFFKKKNG